MSLFNGEHVFPELAQFLPVQNGRIPSGVTEGGLWYDLATHSFLSLSNGVISPLFNGSLTTSSAVLLSSSNGVNTTFLELSDLLGAFLETNSAGIIISATGGTAQFSSNQHVLVSNSGASGTVIQDSGGGGIAVQTTATPGNVSLLTTSGGTVVLQSANFPTSVGGHLNAAITDFAGLVTISSSTSASVSFASNYTGTSAPLVVLTPTSDPTTAGTYWVTLTGSSGAWTGFTVHIHNSATISFNYVVHGNIS